MTVAVYDVFLSLACPANELAHGFYSVERVDVCATRMLSIAGACLGKDCEIAGKQV